MAQASLCRLAGLWRFAGDDRARPRAAGNGRRRKDGDIRVAACQAIEIQLPIADGVELAALESWRRTVRLRRRERVDDTDSGAGIERGDEVVE